MERTDKIKLLQRMQQGSMKLEDIKDKIFETIITIDGETLYLINGESVTQEKYEREHKLHWLHNKVESAISVNII